MAILNETFTGKAHGRVNLIGEHTDYNGGWVLPTAIPQATTVRLTPRNDRKVEIVASNDPRTGDARSVDYRLGEETKSGDWADYLRGATSLLLQMGVPIQGFHAVIESNVPEGSGLSSSAALEMAFLSAATSAFGLRIDGVERAKLGQRIENEFVGARVGIMDQMACNFARAGEALFLDTQSLKYERIPFPVDLIDLIVVNSGVVHRNSGGDYNQRRSECEQACEILGIQSLRELTISDLKRIEALPEILKKRARHVITENARVHDSVAAIREEDPASLGRLFKASHLSMRDDYAVSVPEIDRLVEIFNAEADVFGARLTGGGFGGSVVAICKKGRGLEIGRSAVNLYTRESGKQGTLLVPEQEIT